MQRWKELADALLAGTHVECRVHSGGVAALELDRSTEVAVSVRVLRLESTPCVRMSSTRSEMQGRKSKPGEREQQT